MLEKRILNMAQSVESSSKPTDRNVLRVEPPENAQQGNVGLDNVFKVPILLMKLFVFGVPNKREVSMEE